MDSTQPKAPDLEVFYHGGYWYSYRPPQFTLPPFELREPAGDWRLRSYMLAGLAHRPQSLITPGGA
jgi:hypothetical protein